MTYVLWVVLDKDIKIYVGSLEKLTFRRGIYLYIGSAKRGLKARIERHLSRKKNIFWHIDYLLSSNQAKIKNIWINGKLKECQIARRIQRKGYDFMNKFGSSDCNCPSHLFFINKGAREAQGLLKKGGFIKYAGKNYCSWLK